jgi:hypothetical protein
MNSLKLKQVNHESDTWKRIIAFMLEENVYLKNRLSEVLKNEISGESLIELEAFQTNFIKEDQIIISLKNAVIELDKLLIREIFEDGNIEKKLSSEVHHLRQQIELAEQNFSTLKKNFNNYLTANT